MGKRTESEYLSSEYSDLSKGRYAIEKTDLKSLAEINQCLLRLGQDFDTNIQLLTELCGRLLGATCAIYNRLEGDMLYSCGQWNVPQGYNPRDKPDGHICYDVINCSINGPYTVCNLPETHYSVTDPNVTKYSLKTYLGHPVKCGTSFVGTICAVFQDDVEPRDDDKRIIGIIASAISVEDERRKAQQKIWEQESYLRAILQTAADGFWVVETDGSMIEVNEAYCQMSGYSREELLKMNISDIDALEKRSETLERVKRIIHKGSEIFETQHLRKDGSIFDLEVSVTFLNVEAGKLVCFGRDITERKEREKESEILLDLLRILDQPNGFDELLHDIIKKLHEISNCEAVGIRLKDGDDYPYYQTLGFPESFVRLEDSLCTRDLSGQIIKDELGNPVLECMCGNVICRRFDPKLPFFTSHGSFWTNSTSELLSNTNESDRQARTRNRCNGEGYESVALVPLHVHGETLGLIQFNDKRKGVFTRKIIYLFEKLADNIAQTLEQRKAQAEVKQHKERLESIFRASPTGIGVVENRILKYVNCRISEMTGYSSSELIGFSTRMLYPTQEDYDYVGTEKYHLIAEKGIGAVETRWKRKDGTIIDILLSSTPIDVHDLSKSVTFTALDITQRKQTENALALSEEKYRELVQKSHSIILKWDRQGKVLFLNEFGQRFFGYSEEEITGKDLLGTIVAEQDITAHSLMSDIFRHPEEYENNINENMCKDGRRVWVSWSNNPLYDSEGQMIEMFSVGTDITSEKQAKEKLQLQSLVLDQISDCVTVTDMNGIITYVNNAELQALGYTHEQLAGKPTTKYGDDPERGATQQEILEETLLEGQWHGEVVNKTAEGREVVMDCRTQIVYNETGQAVAICGISTDITERKIQEEQLLRSQRQLSNALNIGKMGHWELDVTSGIFTFSDSFYAIFHTNVKEMGGYEMSIDEYTNRFVYPEDRHLVYEEVLKASDCDNPNSSRYLEHRMIYADGGIGHMTVKFFIVKDCKGKTIRTYGINQDITERRQWAEALRVEKDKLAKIADTVPGAICMFGMKADGSLYIHYVSRAIKEVYGLTSEQMLKDTSSMINILLTGEHEQLHKEAIESARNQSLWKSEFRYNHPMKGLVWIESRFTPVHEGDGNTLWYGIVTDITERKLSENALAHSRNLLRYVIEHTRSAVAVYDRDMHYIYVSQRYLDDYKVKEKDIIGKHHYEVFPDLPQKWRDIHQKALNGEILSAEDDPYYKEDGIVEWTRWECRPWYEADGSIGGIIIYTEVITDRKQAEETLLKAKKAAEAASMAKSEFLAIMSHELRTPLNAVIGFNEILLDTELNEEQKHYAEIINKSGKSLLDIIEDILDFSKIEADKLELDTLDFDLLDLLEGFADTMTLRAHKKGLKLSYDVESDVPSMLYGDPGRLLQILTNLAGNAIKFTSQGEVRIHVSVKSKDDNNVILRFSVKDTGIGIPEDKMELIFDKFTQADASNTRRFGGTGLGLAISKRLVQMMEGDIGVTSEVEKGSEFWFTVRMKEQSKTVPFDRPNQVCSHQKHNHELMILLVEDDIFNQEVALKMLTKLGFNVDVVANGQEAIKALEMIPYDLVLMDVQMPEMDGIEATRLIRDISSAVIDHNIPIIAMTAHAMEGDRERFIEAGMDDYVSKPVTLKVLRELMNKWNGIILKSRELS
ncbi:PAS domain S-box protein [Methanolobus sp. WCC5]|uniref:PAS domain S-box protein n=1 Tax=Methanolobus sp. WCC5 TaxID=3125785 RepID=UPI003250D1F5